MLQKIANKRQLIIYGNMFSVMDIRNISFLVLKKFKVKAISFLKK